MTTSRLGDYLAHIANAARLALSYVEAMTKAQFMADTRTQQAVILNLFVIGEAVTKLLNEYPDFASEHPTIAWKSMKGMRNRIAHGYFLSYRLRASDVDDVASRATRLSPRRDVRTPLQRCRPTPLN